jgi:hemoglobin-like flavoprotein
MTNESRVLQVEQLESSFELLVPRAEELVGRFYERLFAAAPGLRALFPGDMERQERAVVGALVMIMKSLRSPSQLCLYLDGLGRRHVDYGAVPADYAVVGTVLLETMAEFAGEAWTPEVEAAWSNAYAAVSGLMLDVGQATGEWAA